VKGTVLLAKENFNGTIADSREGIDAVLAWLKLGPLLAALDYKESHDYTIPFYRSTSRCGRTSVLCLTTARLSITRLNKARTTSAAPAHNFHILLLDSVQA